MSHVWIDESVRPKNKPRTSASRPLRPWSSDGDDVIVPSLVPDANVAFEVEGGTGNDIIKPGAGRGVVKAGEGAEMEVDGGQVAEG